MKEHLCAFVHTFITVLLYDLYVFAMYGFSLFRYPTKIRESDGLFCSNASAGIYSVCRFQNHCVLTFFHFCLLTFNNLYALNAVYGCCNFVIIVVYFPETLVFHIDCNSTNHSQQPANNQP